MTELLRRSRLVSIERAAQSACHLCQSLLAVREGPTDALITEIRDALILALAERDEIDNNQDPESIERHLRQTSDAGASREAVLLAACQAQHEALDIVLAMLMKQNPAFRPTQSAIWPLLLEAFRTIRRVERGL